MERCAPNQRSDAHLGSLLYRLQAALTLREVQAAYLKEIDGIVPAVAHGIYHLHPATRRPLHVATRGAPDAFLDDYERQGRRSDPVLKQIAESHRPIDSGRVLGSQAWRAHPLYELLARANLDHTLQAPLLLAGEMVGTLDFARRASDPPFTGTELSLLGEVARHVSVAMHRALRYEETRQRSSLAEETLHLIKIPLLVSDLLGNVLFSNLACEELLSSLGNNPVRLQEFERALQQNTDQLLAGPKRVAILPLPSGRSREPVTADRSPPVAEAGRTLILRSVLIPGRVRALITFICAIDPACLTSLPLLSPRERYLVGLVVRGLNNREIAETASISQNTVKQHLKRIYGKLQVGSRAELVAAVLQPDRHPDES